MIELTDGDINLLAMAWACCDPPPKLDMDKLAKMAGYKNKTSASSCFRGVRKKLRDLTTGEGSKVAVTTQSSSKKRKVQDQHATTDTLAKKTAASSSISVPQATDGSLQDSELKPQSSEDDIAVQLEDWNAGSEYWHDIAERLTEEAAQDLKSSDEVM